MHSAPRSPAARGLHAGAHEELKYLKINVYLPTKREDATPSTLRAIRDALLLLGLVARVDPSAWVRIVTTHCGLEAACEVDLLELCTVGQVRFEFHVYDASSVDTPDNWVANMLASVITDPAAAPSDALLLSEAVQQVAALAGRGSRWDAQARLDIPIAVSALAGVSILFLQGLWRALKVLQIKHGAWRFPVFQDASGPEQWSFDCVFVLQSLRITTHGGHTSDDMALLLEEIVTQGEGLQISQLDLAGVGIADDAVRAALTRRRFYERLLCVSGTPEDSRAVVKMVDLKLLPESASEFVRMCSAIAGAQTATRLALHLGDLSSAPPRARRRMWECLAYVLFSMHARSSITSVTITGFALSESDADAAANVIASLDPTRLLFHRSTNEDARLISSRDDGGVDITTAMLKQGTSATLQPIYNDEQVPIESASLTLATDVGGVRVLGNEGIGSPEDVRVVIPGYGPCTVRHDQVVATHAPRPVGVVTSLKLECIEDAPDSEASVARLLRLVGASLTRLSLDLGLGLDRPSVAIDAILVSCPKLTLLVIRDSVINTASLLEACRTHELRIEELIGCFDDVPSLMRELADKCTRLARKLKRLTFGITSTDDPTDGMVAMPETNRTLKYLHVYVRQNGYNLCGAADIQRFHNQAIPVVHSPLPLESRVAFLSVFAARSGVTNGNSTAPSLPEASVLDELTMDRNVLSLIFSFAATGARRRVYVTLSRLSRGVCADTKATTTWQTTEYSFLTDGDPTSPLQSRLSSRARGRHSTTQHATNTLPRHSLELARDADLAGLERVRHFRGAARRRRW